MKFGDWLMFAYFRRNVCKKFRTLAKINDLSLIDLHSYTVVKFYFKICIDIVYLRAMSFLICSLDIEKSSLECFLDYLFSYRFFLILFSLPLKFINLYLAWNFIFKIFYLIYSVMKISNVVINHKTPTT